MLRPFIMSVFFILLSMVAVQADPPKTKTTQFAAYVAAVLHSTDPNYAALRQKLADAPYDLIQEENAATVMGIPLTPEQMQQPQPSGETNAAPLYQKLFALQALRAPLGTFGLPDYLTHLSTRTTYPPKDLLLIRRTLTAHADIVGLIHDAASKPNCVFLRDWSKGLETPLPGFHNFLTIAQILSTETYLLAQDGRYHDAVDNAALSFTVARHSTSDSILQSYEMGFECYMRTLQSFADILQTAGPNFYIDSSVQNAIQNNPHSLSLQKAMAYETGLYSIDRTNCLKLLVTNDLDLSTMGNLDETPAYSSTLEQDNKPRPQQKITPDELTFLREVLTYIHLRTLAHMQIIVAACGLPFSERHAAFEKLDQERSETISEISAKHASDTSFGIDEFVLEPDTISPSYRRLSDQEEELMAARQTILAACAVLTAKARTGQWPEKLPDNDTDPYSGKPLQYRTEGTNGFVIYSVGRDGKFDGGKQGDDIPFAQVYFRYPVVTQPLPKY